MTLWTIWASAADPKIKHRSRVWWQGRSTISSGNRHGSWLSDAATLYSFDDRWTRIGTRENTMRWSDCFLPTMSRWSHSSEYLTFNKINAKSERIECLCEIRHNFANFCILFWYRFYRMMAPCERHRRKLTKDRHEPNSTSSLRLILNCLWWKVSWNLNFLNSSIVSQLYFTIKSYLKSWTF